MKKKNDFLSRMQAKADFQMMEARRFALQQCKDMMLIAASREFGFGKERLKRLSDAYDAVFVEYANMVLSDAKDDKAIWYTKGKVDKELKEALGEYFVEWEERYK